VTDLFLGESDFVEGAPNPKLLRRLPARSIVSAVIGIRAVRNILEPALSRHRLQPSEELAFAMKTSIGVVSQVLVAVHFLGWDGFVRDVKFLDDLLRHVPLVSRIARAFAGHGQRSIP
jgi:hypothetical protein